MLDTINLAKKPSIGIFHKLRTMSGGCGSFPRAPGAQHDGTSVFSAGAADSAAAGALIQLARHGNNGNLPAQVTGAPIAAIAEAFAPDGKIALSVCGTPLSRGELIAFFHIAAKDSNGASRVQLAQHLIDTLRHPCLADTTAKALSRAWSRITTDPGYLRFVRQWKLGYNAGALYHWLKKPWQLRGTDNDGGGSSASASVSAAAAPGSSSSATRTSRPLPSVAEAAGAAILSADLRGNDNDGGGSSACASSAAAAAPGSSSSASRTSRPVRSVSEAAEAAILSADLALDSGDRIAAMQAGWTEGEWSEAVQEMERSSSSVNRGSIVFQLSNHCAQQMREFALAWIRYVRKNELGRHHFGRNINNAEEIFVFPVGTEHEKEDIRQTATLFLDTYRKQHMAFPEQVGLTPVACMAQGGFMRELEVKIHIALRQYGDRVGQPGYRRMVLHSMSLIRFSRGRPPQHEHFDLLGTNCWAFIVNLSECTCGKQCKFKGTRLFRECNGQGAPQLSPECNEHTETIFAGLCNGIPIDDLCSVLPSAVAQSARDSFDAFGNCVTAEAVRNAFAPVSEDARLGEVWGTNGMHGAPGNSIQECDRLVLFLAAAPEGQSLYDGGTQTNGALIMGIYHGLFSLEYLQYIVETELVDGMPVTGHMFSDMNVSGEELHDMRVPATAFRETVRHSPAHFLQQADFWEEIVRLVHNTIHGGTTVPTVYRGQIDDSNPDRRLEGEDRAKVREICTEVYKVLQCDQQDRRRELIQGMETKFKTGNERSRSVRQKSRRQPVAHWENLANVWKKARDNHGRAVRQWLLTARSRGSST
jgi:hypothetical protein